MNQKKQMQLGLCTIVTEIVEEMCTFYSSILEKTPEVYRNNYFYYPTAGASVALWRKSEYVQFHGPLLSENKGSHILIEFEVEDVNAEYDRITNLDISPLGYPRTLPWGHRNFTVKDPEDNIIIIYSVLQ